MTVEEKPTADRPPPFRTRLDVLFAAHANRAVILRRGPKTHYRLIAWDLANDTFTPGQWMKGLVKLCDLSPDGRTLIYWAAQYHSRSVDRRERVTARGTFSPVRAGTAKAAESLLKRGRKVPRYLRPPGAPPTQLPHKVQDTWTAVSPVPYFSALAIWPAFGHWTGGGFFFGDNRIALFEPENRMVPVVNVPIPARVHVQSAFSLRGAGTQRSARGPDHAFNATNRLRLPPDAQAHLDDLEAAIMLSGFDIIEWVHAAGEDVLFAADGAVFRVTDGAKLPPDAYAAAARKLIDLSAMSFEGVRAPPESMRWGT